MAGEKIQGNAAATSISMLFIVVAMVFGIAMKYKRLSNVTQFIVELILLVAMLAVGIAFPL
ncbi:hypothetical protein [Metaclostridioides mangenotii]|uniref:hypothetical protein n=1 Tax=Metaclostridioides mangenotii TaxID=1540 RepID=UPI000481ED65|nr:hypothetical protein [Clostridioides mangenotii]